MTVATVARLFISSRGPARADLRRVSGVRLERVSERLQQVGAVVQYGKDRVLLVRGEFHLLPVRVKGKADVVSQLVLARPLETACEYCDGGRGQKHTGNQHIRRVPRLPICKLWVPVPLKRPGGTAYATKGTPVAVGGSPGRGTPRRPLTEPPAESRTGIGSSG